MGDLTSHIHARGQVKLQFINALIHDVEALERMIQEGKIETGVQRIGAEQEICIVNSEWLPDNNSLILLEKLNDTCCTTELARYNMEVNCDPLEIRAGCFLALENALTAKYDTIQEVASTLNSRIILTGILPTISRKEITLDYLTPLPRYHFLNQQLCKKRGNSFNLYMKGVDELHLHHDNIMFEACNTSFQAHLQVDPGDFVDSYNWAQAISAPILAAASNSPLLFGKELWSEIRIALFQQSIETRKSVEEIRDLRPRVTFGKDWIRHSITDIYKEDIARFDILFTVDDPEHALQKLNAGKIPLLQALRLHNGTVYRWNRPCYGVNEGVAHLRIENRYMPAGPSIADEVANLAFWTGLMLGKPDEAHEIWHTFSFRDVKSNFFKAARSGIETVFVWKGKEISARTLILEELIPMAYKGLVKSGLSEEECDYFLGIIKSRLANHTGSQWQIHNFRKLREKLSPSDAAIAITAAMCENQMQHKAVHEWKDIELSKATSYLVNHFTTVKQLMSTDLITVFPDDSLLLAESIMHWFRISHMLIENKKGELIGLITSSKIAALKEKKTDLEKTLIKEHMTTSLHTIQDDHLITDAFDMMQKHQITSLPVVHKGKMIGIVTRNDMLRWLSFREG